MIKPILDLFFPRLCHACEKAKTSVNSHLCLACLRQLPRFYLHEKHSRYVQQRFWGRVPLCKASSFLYFEVNGMTQSLIHQIKYQGQTELAITLGKLAGSELKVQGFFESIDCIVPLPLHQLKQKKRGYNQSELLARGLSISTGLPLEIKSIAKVKNTASQTNKSRFMRWRNVKDSFQLAADQKLKGRHVLLVDDVLTTGATAEACALELLKVDGLRLSFLSLAIPF